MVGKFKNKQEAILYLRERNQRVKPKIYDDWYYRTLVVDVCDIYDDELICTVTRSTAKRLQKRIEENNTKMYALGEWMMRGYAMRRFVFRRGRFSELPEWSKQAYLVEFPEAFEPYEKNFSPALKKYITRLRNNIQESKK